MPRVWAIARAVPGWSPVTITTRIPAARHSATAAAASGRTGSMNPASPSRTSGGSSSHHPPGSAPSATAMTRNPPSESDAKACSTRRRSRGTGPPGVAIAVQAGRSRSSAPLIDDPPLAVRLDHGSGVPPFGLVRDAVGQAHSRLDRRGVEPELVPEGEKPDVDRVAVVPPPALDPLEAGLVREDPGGPDAGPGGRAPRRGAGGPGRPRPSPRPRTRSRSRGGASPRGARPSRGSAR